jgi:hypothetical protein
MMIAKAPKKIKKCENNFASGRIRTAKMFELDLLCRQLIDHIDDLEELRTVQIFCDIDEERNAPKSIIIINTELNMFTSLKFIIKSLFFSLCL